jgi:superfamily I DNA/RNA helicase
MSGYVATSEQQAILDAGLVPLKVIACAGSGKTATAVRRLVEVRRAMGAGRGYAVLLSYSNIAVDTFRNEYLKVASRYAGMSERVLISTVDSFITNSILLPHGGTSMGCSRRPFLVHGSEVFLENKSFNTFDGTRPIPIVDVDLRKDADGNWGFINTKTNKPLPDENAMKAVKALARTGAYTHPLGRFWAVAALEGVPRLAQILSARYPHILVDEAQDIGSLHGEALRLLEAAGSTLGLVGDPNQAIYEFADADGSFLRNFALPGHGIDQPITQNRRSVSQVVDFANKIAGTSSIPIRKPPVRRHGTYYLQYEPAKLEGLMDAFSTILSANSYSIEEAAVLARGATLVYQLNGGRDGFGVGATKFFAEAAVHRDSTKDIALAFERALDGTMRLLEIEDHGLRQKVLSSKRDSITRVLRLCVWKFLRDSSTGLPAATLNGKAWHASLKTRLDGYLSAIESDCGLVRRATWKNNVTIRDLGEDPLYKGDLATKERGRIRVSTVHKVKGESIGAVLYVTNTQALNSLLKGPETEEGRIGYVAATRAADLLVLAIPKGTKKATLDKLSVKGVVAWTD